MKSSQSPIKHVIGCWTSLGTTLIYTKEECQSAHGVQGLQKTYFKAHIIHGHGPMGFVVGEAKNML